MKRVFTCLALALTMAASALADEGMWLLPLLQKMNEKDMKATGLKLSAKDIYDINHSSLKDAIVHFGGGCTGEMISDNGLLITNHHCGYSNIQALSTPEHNYLEDGYFAMNRNQELPVPGLSVTFLKSMTDVTSQVEKGLKKGKALQDVTAEIVADAQKDKANKNCRVSVTSFYNSNMYFLIVSKVYTDVRFVGAPPASMGKFGGETDNWMWPRHTCDFSMFRVYAGKDGEPAAYSADNVPFKPAKSLTISLAGTQAGDYAMIMGYPGSTQRFQTAAQLDKMVKTNNVRVAARTVRQDIMWSEMRADETVGLQYANKYASSANGWKKWQGMDLAFKNLGIIEKEQQKEADFEAWAKANKKNEYVGIVGQINAISDATREVELASALLTESVAKIEVVTFASRFVSAYNSAVRQGRSASEALAAARRSVAANFKDYSAKLDKLESTALIDHYKANVKPGAELKLEGMDFMSTPTQQLTEWIFQSAFLSEAAMENIKSLDDAMADPAYKFYSAVADASAAIRAMAQTPAGTSLSAANKTYTAGILEWTKGQPSYPDANSTMRLTYGTVLPYSPKDGVEYKHFTTLKGVMEKEDPTNYEFRVPAKLKDIYNAGDYGQYADQDGTVHTCFLTNCDITGGNSGSPVLNDKGELIGLAFDGNWESMSSDVMFEPDLQRCICVDIRFVLLMVDKFGGAGYLLDEMKIARK